MGQIIYQIVSGTPDFTIVLSGPVIVNETKTEIGIYSFDDVPDGAYTLSITDGNGCKEMLYITISSNSDCILEGTALNLYCTLAGNALYEGITPTTTTTTTIVSTTTTTTILI